MPHWVKSYEVERFVLLRRGRARVRIARLFSFDGPAIATAPLLDRESLLGPIRHGIPFPCLSDVAKLLWPRRKTPEDRNPLNRNAEKGFSYVFSVADALIRALSASAGFFKRKKHFPHNKNPALALRARIRPSAVVSGLNTLNKYGFSTQHANATARAAPGPTILQFSHQVLRLHRGCFGNRDCLFSRRSE